MTTTTLYPTKNSYTTEWDPSSNASADQKMVIGVDGRTGSGSQFMWLGFDLSSIPAGSTINSAYTDVNEYFAYNNSSYSNYNFNIHRSTNLSWTEATLTYAAEPSFGSVLDTQYFGYDIGIHRFTVTSAVASALSTGGISLTIRPDNPGSWSDFIQFYFGRVPYSITHAPEYSRLIVDYTPASTFKPLTMMIM